MKIEKQASRRGVPPPATGLTNSKDLDHAEGCQFQYHNPSEFSRWCIASAAVVTPLVVVAGGPPAADPITMLAAEFEAAWAASNEFFRNMPEYTSDEDYERMFRPVSDLADRIANMKATTLDGLRLKARALMWCDEEVGFMDGNTTDERLARGIVHDLLNLKQATA